MKKILFAAAIFSTIIACKKDAKQEVIKTESGQEMIVTEKGDTIVKPTENNDSISSTATDSITAIAPVKQVAIQKNTNDKYAFRYNLEIGKTYPITLKIKGNQSATDGSQSMNMGSESDKTIEYTVKDFKNGVYTLEVKSKRYSEKMTDPSGQSISYDTNNAKPKDKNIAFTWSIYKAMIGKPYTLKIDQKGKVVGVEGLDKIRKQIETSVKGQLSAEEQKFVSEMLKASLNKETISAQFDETMNIFPDKELKLKESWTDTDNINQGPMKGKSNLTRTLASVDTKNTKITVKGTQNLSGSETQEGVKMSVNANANIDGTILLDTESGWINNVNLTKKETMKRSIDANGQKQTMTETVTTKTSIN
jgi:hypothetical protein